MTAGLSLRTTGDGPAVLWIHGYTMDSTIWDPLWALLPGWRHIGVDLPGHGDSAPLRPGSTLPGLATDLARLAREQEAHRVVALSFGSMAALQLAIDAPDQVHRLIVGAPTIAGRPPEPGTGDRYRALMMLARAGADGAALADLWMQSPPDIFRGTERHPAVRTHLRKIISKHGWQELRTGAMHAFTRHVQTDQSLARIRAATLAIVGTEDMPTFVDNAHLLHRCAPSARVRPLDEAGHLCLIERPDAVAPEIAAHLSYSAAEHRTERHQECSQATTIKSIYH